MLVVLRTLVGCPNCTFPVHELKGAVAGSDTSHSAMLTFLQAMAIYPEVQRRAQAELDAVVDPSRLPEFTDRARLPYVEALVKEVLRWQPVAPLGVPHAVTEDDVYEGYHIPRGATVIANSWAIFHNEKDYPDPFMFSPERFLKSTELGQNVLDPARVAFGFGRRACPGRYLAMNGLFIYAASMLSTFCISLAVDENGQKVPIEMGMTTGFASFPKPFHCSITVSLDHHVSWK